MTQVLSGALVIREKKTSFHIKSKADTAHIISKYEKQCFYSTIFADNNFLPVGPDWWLHIAFPVVKLGQSFPHFTSYIQWLLKSANLYGWGKSGLAAILIHLFIQLGIVFPMGELPIFPILFSHVCTVVHMCFCACAIFDIRISFSAAFFYISYSAS